MKFAHNVIVNVFCKQGEDEEKIRRGLFSLFLFSIKKQFNRQVAGKFEGNGTDIRILQVELSKDKEINGFLKHLRDNINGTDMEQLLGQLDSRLDEDCNFFVRFDKSGLMSDKKLVLTDLGDCYHVKIGVAAYPKKKEEAREVMLKAFAQQDI